MAHSKNVMHLNRFTDYTLRTLFLTAANPNRLVRLSEIANYYQISIDHLRKVVHNLSKLGYLETHRGKNGGMKLAQTPDNINIGQIVAETEGVTPLIDCGSDCTLTPLCSLTGLLNEAQQAFFDTLNQYTLQDLIADPHMLRMLQLPINNH